ncbi:hypothetical protein BZG35_00895 [Brevundimonas sp. LM2]|uniref:hypothetical protein n=1 Tax=Brevundimonas sp. LM2 TaxID=1938605 RepID=UPI0009840258|nr:hypothetical protein [Brevundimonas sp. LM2]AQR60371.1 hypothetical protein BZG35_00895 [Brevundimonas sp. LM2]
MSHDDPHSKAADAVHEGRPVEAQYAKGGKGGRRISAGMGIAIVLTAIGFIVVFLMFSGAFNRPGDDDADNQTSQAQAFSDDDRVPAADAPTTSTGEPTSPPTGEAPNVNAPTVQAAPSSN